MSHLLKRLAVARAIRRIEKRGGTFLFQPSANTSARPLSVRLSVERLLGIHFFGIPTALAIEKFEADDEELDEILLFESLKELVVYDSEIGDLFVTQLTDLKALESLSLVHTEVSNAGLSILASMESLRSLVVVDCSITPQGVEEFKKMRPDCEVIDYPLVDPDDPFDLVACYDGFRCHQCSEEKSLKGPSGEIEWDSLRVQVKKLKEAGWVVHRTLEGDFYVTCPKCSTGN